MNPVEGSNPAPVGNSLAENTTSPPSGSMALGLMASAWPACTVCGAIAVNTGGRLTVTASGMPGRGDNSSSATTVTSSVPPGASAATVHSIRPPAEMVMPTGAFCSSYFSLALSPSGSSAATCTESWPPADTTTGSSGVSTGAALAFTSI